MLNQYKKIVSFYLSLLTYPFKNKCEVIILYRVLTYPIILVLAPLGIILTTVGFIILTILYCLIAWILHLIWLTRKKIKKMQPL